MTLNHFKIDPSLATGTFVTPLNYIFGLTTYFSIGQQVMERLGM